ADAEARGALIGLLLLRLGEGGLPVVEPAEHAEPGPARAATQLVGAVTLAGVALRTLPAALAELGHGAVEVPAIGLVPEAGLEHGAQRAELALGGAPRALGLGVAVPGASEARQAGAAAAPVGREHRAHA